MSTNVTLSRLDIAAIFCDIDDFCQLLEQYQSQYLTFSSNGEGKLYRSRLSISEVMTIVVAFHGSGYRTFKEFYTIQVLPHWRQAFPTLVSYNRFIELMPWSIMPLTCFINLCCLGEMTGISFVDSTPLKVCHPRREHSHKVFKGFAAKSKTSTGWFFGFKLHLVINDRGELLGFALTPGNTDDRKPVPEMVAGLTGKLFGDRGYISQDLFEKLYAQGLEFISRRRKNMKNSLMKLTDKILLRKRAIIESVNDQLKNICQIEHTRHRSHFNFIVNVLGGLVAYSYHPTKPSLDLDEQELCALHTA